MGDGFENFAAPGRHTRRPERPGLRRVCVAALIMLVLQFGLGIILNLYVAVPADAHAGIITEITTAPLALTVHALLGVCLIGTAILLVARALAGRDRLLTGLAGGGLAAIGGAFVAGEIFVKNGEDSASFVMAMLTAAALLCYVGILALATGGRLASAQETEPLLLSVPAARPRDLADYPASRDEEFQWDEEPGWDEDPGWVERLAERPAARQEPPTGRGEQWAGWAEPQAGHQPSRPAGRPAVRPEHRGGWAEPQADWRPQRTDWGEQPVSWEEQQADWREHPISWEEQQADWGGQQADWGGQQADWGGQQARLNEQRAHWNEQPVRWDGQPASRGSQPQAWWEQPSGGRPHPAGRRAHPADQRHRWSL